MWVSFRYRCFAGFLMVKTAQRKRNTGKDGSILSQGAEDDRGDCCATARKEMVRSEERTRTKE
jgi:hypothetical protein